MTLKFEWPKGLYKPIPYTFSDGTKGVWNTAKFNEDAAHDYNERIKILDMAMGIESQLNEFIGKLFISNRLNYLQFEELILNRISFEGKIEVFENLLKNLALSYLFLNNKKFTIKFTENNEVIIDKFIININKLIELIKDIKDIRNNSVHIYSPIFGKDTIHRRTNKYHGVKVYDKNEILIKGNFIIWLLQRGQKENWINRAVLEEFYNKYKNVLIGVAKPKGEDCVV